MSSSNNNEIDAHRELEKIIDNHYVNSPIFRSELYRILCEKTGNNNLGIICDHIISDKLIQQTKIVT